jgi:hypothetical protein
MVAFAAEPDGYQVGHPEQGSDAANMHDRVCLARKTLPKMAEIRGGAANVDHNRFFDSGEIGGPAHRVGGTGRKAVDRKRSGAGSLRDGAVVLGDEQRRRQPDPALGGLEAADSLLGKGDQRRVQDRGILPLEQADAAKKMRTGDRYARNFLAQDRRNGFLVGRVQR